MTGFEDKKGGEQLWVQAERNLDTVVKHSETRTVGADSSLQVGGTQTQGIGGDRTLTVGGAQTHTIRRDLTLNVSEGRHTSTVKGDVSITSLDGAVTVVSPRKITFAVGGSTITLTPDEIVINAGKIFLNP